jgi:hypothetical protein
MLPDLKPIFSDTARGPIQVRREFSRRLGCVATLNSENIGTWPMLLMVGYYD